MVSSLIYNLIHFFFIENEFKHCMFHHFEKEKKKQNSITGKKRNCLNSNHLNCCCTDVAAVENCMKIENSIQKITFLEKTIFKKIQVIQYRVGLLYLCVLIYMLKSLFFNNVSFKF